MNGDFSSEEPREAARAVRLQAIFRAHDEQTAQTIAAKMIDRAHEIANLPEYECDVDVSVEWMPSESSSEAIQLGSSPARSRPPER